MNIQSEQKRISFGYNRGPVGQIEVHPGQEATVKLVFQMYEEGNSLAQIADILEGIKIPSPQNRPKWGRQALSNILSNAHYIGVDNYPIIIGEEQFQIVQQIKNSRTK